MSKSGRLRPVKVIVPYDYGETPYVAAHREPHFVSAIAAITAAGEGLTPGLIVRRETLHPDLESLPIGEELPIYSTEKAFVTERVFGAYLTDVITPYIERTRGKLRQDDAKAVLLWDGHGAHDSATIRSKCAINNVRLICIPPHSSHVLQPLDQVYFSRVKQLFAQSRPVQGLSKLSQTILRVVNAFDGANCRYLICTSWRQTGIQPVIEKRVVKHVSIEEHIMDDEPSIQHVWTQETVNERERGEPTEKARWGMLNESERELLEAGQCPLCCGVLPAGWLL